MAVCGQGGWLNKHCWL